MKSMRIRYKVTLVVGLGVTIGLLAVGYFYASRQEQSAMAQNERTMLKLTESVTQGLQSVMLAGSADIAQSFADRLKRIPEVENFRIVRNNGDEAFLDNKTILEVNRRRGEEAFAPRDTEDRISILAPDSPILKRVLDGRVPLPVYETTEGGVRVLNYYAPILNDEQCYKCHGKASPVRGVIVLSTSLAPIERDILRVRQQSLIVIGVALMGIMLMTGFMMGRTIVLPIERVSNAMTRVSDGDLNHSVKTGSDDELGVMADRFNRMTSELKTTYDGLRREQDKLTTIIHGAGEGIVVTDGEDRIVLVNPAAERLLGKDVSRIVSEGFDSLLDDPKTLADLRDNDGGKGPLVVEFNGHVLNIFASTIRGADGHVVGSAALLRDITEEKRLEEELRRLSTTDGLTGLYNRRFLDESLSTELNRARRSQAPLSVIMFDVDHFKRFNDTHGHDQGDRVLQGVARALRDALRKYDLPCRFGGEEFLAILPNTPGAGALAVAERLRKDIDEMVVDGLRVTISLGVATWPELEVASSEQLVERADQALYQSKAAGRNRTTVALPPAAMT